MAAPGGVTLDLLDLQGRRVALLLDTSTQPVGRRSESFTLPGGLRAGVYWLRFDCLGRREMRKLVVAR